MIILATCLPEGGSFTDLAFSSLIDRPNFSATLSSQPLTRKVEYLKQRLETVGNNDAASVQRWLRINEVYG